MNVAAAPGCVCVSPPLRQFFFWKFDWDQAMYIVLVEKRIYQMLMA